MDQEAKGGSEGKAVQVSDQVASALDDEHQQLIDRRIDLRQQADLEAIDSFSKVVPISAISAADRDSLERTLFDVTEQITILIDEGHSAKRPWSEIRSDMDEVTRSGLEDLKRLLSPDELRRFGEISREVGTTLVVPETNNADVDVEAIVAPP